MRLTDEQRAAVEKSGSDILVSAAAGSGKTSVLIERIFRLITKEGIDCDRLLVVTYTRAAAREMKDRLRRRIEEALRTLPGDERLRRQEVLLHQAQIATIHSFCQSVIRDHFAEADADPQARVADEGETQLMKADVLDEVLHALYEEGDEDFLRMTETFCADASDSALTELVELLYEKAVSFPDPEAWLMAQEAQAFAEGFENLPEVRYALSETKRGLTDSLALLAEATELATSPGGPLAYAETFAEDTELITDALSGMEQLTYDEMRTRLLSLRFPVLKRVGKKTEVDPEKQAAAKNMRDEVKAYVKDLTARFYAEDSEAWMRLARESAVPFSSLIRTTQRFLSAYAQKKREAHLMDFSDMEHIALRILARVTQTEDGAFAAGPTDAAREYRAHFAEIMVDEYQDVSMVQEMLLTVIAGRSGEEEHTPRFMVGDVKQSIYRFRLARPEIFMEKLGGFAKDGRGEGLRIDLHNNFRSGPAILHSVNTVFDLLMGADIGGVEYDADAHLRAGDDTRQHDNAYATELMITEETGTGIEAEGRMIAERIRMLRETLLIPAEGGAEGELRPVSYRDIVILLRTQKGRDEALRAVLEAENIPVYVDSRTGYFSAWEVQVMLQMLSALNNPLQDIALVSVLRTVIGGFSDAEIAAVRAEGMRTGADAYFYELLQRVAEAEDADGEKAPLREKCADFLARFEALRGRAVFLPVHLLIRMILEESGFLTFVSAMPEGERRAANLEILIRKAQEYEKTSYRGLARFIGYIEALRRFQYDEGEANLLDEHADVVRIMSIHKSKGLEFPVVFVAGLHHQFNFRDARGDLLVDADLGAGVVHLDPEERIRTKTLKREVIAHKMSRDMRGEELRVLYVAMTRAREKLILTATARDMAKMRMSFGEGAAEMSSGRIHYLSRSRAMSFLKWLELAYPCAGDALQVTLLDADEREEVRTRRREETAARRERMDAWEAQPCDTGIKEHLTERFAYVYPHESLCRVFAKTTVTELKEARMDEEGAPEVPHPFRQTEEEDIRPLFLQSDAAPGVLRRDAMTAGRRGTLYHRVMELIPASLLGKAGTGKISTKEVNTYIADVIERGLLAPEAAEVVRTEDIMRFLSTPLAARMGAAAAAGQIRRERQFMIGVPASSIDETLPGEEMTLIQGIVDCFFEEDGAIVIVDYKTDRVDTAKELTDRYRVQLDYYAKALQAITGKEVKECLIYSFALGEVISCA